MKNSKPEYNASKGKKKGIITYKRCIVCNIIIVVPIVFRSNRYICCSRECYENIQKKKAIPSYLKEIIRVNAHGIPVEALSKGNVANI